VPTVRNIKPMTILIMRQISTPNLSKRVMITSLKLIVMEALDLAVDNDIIKKENEYDKLKFDENGDEIQYDTPLGPPPEKLRFRLVTNLKLP